MVATLFLLGCALLLQQPPQRLSPTPPKPPPLVRGDWPLVPRLSRGQELVYLGTYQEEAHASGVEYQHIYRVETRAFVLETNARGMEVVFFTVLRPVERQRPRPGNATEPVALSLRLERATVDWRGKVRGERGVKLSVPLDGPPTLECGAFVEAARGRTPAEQPWDVSETDRPLRSWRVIGNEMVHGTSCVKLLGVQQSEDWDQPRADHVSWRRRDTVWVAPHLGIAYRVERVIERREPAHQQPTGRSVLRYERESNLHYLGQLYDDRRQEIEQLFAFRERLAPLLPMAAQADAELAALLKKIAYHLDQQPPTPYREAILHIKHRIESARNGESVPPPLTEETTAPPLFAAVASVGERAPDFLVSQMTGTGMARLQRYLGRPVLLVFYNPTAPTSEGVLRYAQRLAAAQRPRLTVLGMSVSGNADKVRQQHGALGLSFPILNGSGLRSSYEIEATPKLVLLDAQGIVRGAYLGWGHETAREIVTELKQWLPPR